MFRVEECIARNCFVLQDGDVYLHSDGSIYGTGEYWPTREDAQAVLDKFQPKHVWKHGDVFINRTGTTMIYIMLINKPQIFCCPGECSGHVTDMEYYLENAKFLFNIKEKI